MSECAGVGRESRSTVQPASFGGQGASLSFASHSFYGVFVACDERHDCRLEARHQMPWQMSMSAFPERNEIENFFGFLALAPVGIGVTKGAARDLNIPTGGTAPKGWGLKSAHKKCYCTTLA